jgi:hypothetical protein
MMKNRMALVAAVASVVATVAPQYAAAVAIIPSPSVDVTPNIPALGRTDLNENTSRNFLFVVGQDPRPVPNGMKLVDSANTAIAQDLQQGNPATLNAIGFAQQADDEQGTPAMQVQALAADLDNVTKETLLKVASDLRIKVASRWTKAKIIQAMQQATQQAGVV